MIDKLKSFVVLLVKDTTINKEINYGSASARLEKSYFKVENILKDKRVCDIWGGNKDVGEGAMRFTGAYEHTRDDEPAGDTIEEGILE